MKDMKRITNMKLMKNMGLLMKHMNLISRWGKLIQAEKLEEISKQLY